MRENHIQDSQQMLISKMVKVLGTYPLSTATDFEGSEKPKEEPL